MLRSLVGSEMCIRDRYKALWTELDLLNNEFEISWNWVKAHSTDELNNEVDLLAKDAANL